MNPHSNSKLSQSSSSGSLSGENYRQKSPSSTLSSFFSNIGQSITNHTSRDHHHPSFASRLNTPPPSPNSTTSSVDYHGSRTDLSTIQLFGRYKIKYIGSTALRRRHTLPMLNWIVTDLVYQCKCDGDELHIKIRNCMKEHNRDNFERLRSQITSPTQHHGLDVYFDMCQVAASQRSTNVFSSGPPASGSNIEIAFQVFNKADGQMLLNHRFRQVHLFGKFMRKSSLFFYLHKDQAGDEVTSRPTLFVFQAKDEAQMSEICVKYNELRPKLQISNDKHLFVNSLNSKTGVTSNCFEVLHVGSVIVNTKRASPQIIDRAAQEFNQVCEEIKEEDEEKHLEAAKETISAPVDDGVKTLTGDSVSVPDSTGEQVPVKSDSPIPSESPSGGKTRRQYRTNRFLVEVIDENEPLESHLRSEEKTEFIIQTTSAPTTLISNTQSLDVDTRTTLLNEFKHHQGLAHQISNPGEQFSKTDVRNVDFEKQKSQEEEEEKNKQQKEQAVAAPSALGGGLKRSSSGETAVMGKEGIAIQMQMENFTASSSSTTSATNNKRKNRVSKVNKTMLFIIGQMDICLISTENHRTVFSKTFSNISHCSQGIIAGDHFGIVVREPVVPAIHSDTYVCHIFKGQTEQIVNELLCSLRQAFNNAYRANKMRQMGTIAVDKQDLIDLNEGAKAPREPYCDNCPMNWFHQLCLDTDGLDNETIFSLLMFRIEQHSSEDKRKEFHFILDSLKLKEYARKVDILMILLKVRAERMQRKHEQDGCRLNTMTIYNQCEDEQNSRSTSSLTKLEGLRMMAKSSIANTFESLFKINKSYPSNESLHNKSFAEPLPHSGAITTVNDSMAHRRNTLADCSPETAAQVLGQDSSSQSREPMEKSQSLGQSEQKSLLKLFMKVSGSQNKLNSLEELSAKLELETENEEAVPEPHSPNQVLKPLTRTSSVNSQLRHKLYKRIKRSMRECDLSGQPRLVSESEAETAEAYVPKRRNSRELWRDAIKQQILLNKMNKQNQQNEGTECPVTPAINRARVEYEEIPRIESEHKLEQLFNTWDRLIRSYASSGGEETNGLEGEIIRALKCGVPRNKKRDVWRFLVAFRKKDPGSLVQPECSGQTQRRSSRVKNATYRDLLKQLAVQQHAILVDLGRTYPSVAFFGEAMGVGQLALFNLLKAYSLYDKEVEYCQGLSFVAGILLLHMCEDEAFDLMRFVLYDCGLREQYKPDMEALQMQMYQLSRLLYEQNRQLHDHLDRHEVLPTLYAAPCFLTLFASQYSIAFVSRVIDYLIFYGIEAIFRILFALMERISERILSCDDFEAIMELLRSDLSSLTQADAERVFERVLEFNFSKQLEQYRVEYRILQEEFAHLSLINSKTYTSQPNVNRDARLPSVDRFLGTSELSGSNESMLDSRKRHASEVAGVRSELGTELTKVKEQRDALEKEVFELRDVIQGQQRQIESLHSIAKQKDSDHNALRDSVRRLEIMVAGIQNNPQVTSVQDEALTQQPVRAQSSQSTRTPKKSSESDDDKCFVYVDAEEFPDPL